MKNHWLERKEEKEFIQALDETCEQAEKIEAEFEDSDFVDLSAAKQTNSRYKEYERLADVDDMTLVKNIISQYKDNSAWMSSLMSHITNLQPLQQTISSEGFNSCLTICSGDLNINISQCITMPGGDGIYLKDITVGM